MKAVSNTALLVAAICGCFVLTQSCTPTSRQDTSKRVKVRFGMLPYGDHTYAIIGAKKGWFEEVGITFDYRAIKIEDAVPFVRNGSLDVVSVPPGVIMTAYESSPGVVSFVFGDIFQGFAIMARSDAGYKSVSEFMQSGLSPDAAIKAAVKQMTGKTFAYPAEASVKPFIDLAIHKGGLDRAAFKSLVLDDPLTVNAMRNKQADFQVGGVPSRLTLQREGFKPIVSAADLAKIAKPSAESDELASIFTDGWACTRDYYQRNRDTVLRLASVNFRITKFMNENMDEALAIHMPYLSQVTGQTFTPAEGAIFYKSLDPFFTFEAQQPWYHDENSVDYYKHMNGAIINNFAKQGIYKQKPPTVDDVSVAAEVYWTLEKLRDSAKQKLAQLSSSSGDDKLKACIAQAQRYFDAYDYLDADNTAGTCPQAK